MTKAMQWRAAAALACAFSAPAFALTPAEVFEKVAPSVWAVRGLDATERPFSYGSAVVIGPGRLVTNCHVLAKAKTIQLRQDGVSYEAKLEHADYDRDLCTLTAAKLTAPAVQILPLREVKVGQRVYAVGNPEKLALTLSEGLISGLRTEDPKLPPLQTSAPISPGSSGGGLFDEQARLIGITTLMVVGRQRVAQNLNFAVPAEWVGDVVARAKVTAAPPTAAHAGLPAIGAMWKYSFADRRYSTAEQTFTVRVTGVEGFQVREAFETSAGGRGNLTIDVKSLEFIPRRLAGEYSVMEVGPYFYSTELGRTPDAPQRPSSYPLGSGAWRVDAVRVRDEEAVVVPAGTFKGVLRIEITGSNFSPVYNQPSRFEYTAWYAPQVKRYVKVQHQTWSRNGLVDDELVQLIDFKTH